MPQAPTIEITYDLFGHCVFCHKNMVIEKVIDGRWQTMMSPDYTETEFMLDDGSKMRVALCKSCKPEIKEKDHKKIMKAVIEGWKVETEQIKEWSREKKTKHMNRYSKKVIAFKSEGLDGTSIEKKYIDFKKRITDVKKTSK